MACDKNESEGAIMNSGVRGGGEGDNSMPGSNRLLDHDFRSELERLSQIALKSPTGRRRTDKRRSPSRGPVSLGRDKGDRPIPEDIAMSAFFADLIKTSSRKALLIVLDASETMEKPSAATGLRKYDQARKLAAALSIVLLDVYERTQIVVVGQARGSRSPVLKPGLDAKEAAMELLKALRPGGKPRFVHVLQRHVKRLVTPTDCIVISDLNAPEWEPAMALLAHSESIHASVIRISDPSEIKEANDEYFMASASESQGRALDIDVSRRLRAIESDNVDEWADLEIVEPGDYLRVMTDQPFERALITALKDR